MLTREKRILSEDRSEWDKKMGCHHYHIIVQFRTICTLINRVKDENIALGGETDVNVLYISYSCLNQFIMFTEEEVSIMLLKSEIL